MNNCKVMEDVECCIVGDPEGKSWDFITGVYDEVKGRDRWSLNEVEIKRFPDGEIKPKIKENVRKRDCYFIHDSRKAPADWFLELCLINEALRNSSANRIYNIFPYMRFVRQERKDESRVPISSRVVADNISRYANGVLTIDVHNQAIQGFYPSFDNLHSFRTVVDYFRKNHPEYIENVVVMSPDAGGGNRAEAFAKWIQAREIAIGAKHRDGDDVKIRLTGEVKDRNVIIVDDIIASGTTLIEGSCAARQEGARKVGVYATHGLFTEGLDRLEECLDFIVVGNTVVSPEIKNSGRVEVVDFSKLFGEAIRRVHRGESLSELFK